MKPKFSRHARAERLGRKAELRAALALMAKGYRILALRYRTHLGEIDLIARKGDLVAMVEVKARRSLDEAVDAVTATSKKRISNAADLWLSKQRDATRISIRFDIVAVLPWRWPTHLEDAF